MLADLKFAVRSLRSAKTHTAAVLTVLILGIGATTAIFSVVDAVVLRGLPFDEHDRLVAVGEQRMHFGRAAGDIREPDALAPTAPQNYLDWGARQHVFERMSAIASGSLTLHMPGGEPESLVVQRVSAEFFDVLRVRPAIGRAFTTENEAAGRHRVAVLSDGLWRSRFGGDPKIIGRILPIDDVAGARDSYEVLGVMPADFAYPPGGSRSMDLWVPYVVPAHQRIRVPGSRSDYLQVVARLKPGVSLAEAQVQMNQIAGALENEHPVWNKENKIGVRPLIDHIVGSRTRSWMLMLLGAVGIVLLIACANVASLLLARAAERDRELGLRAALGGPRWRLVRQLIVESLVLSVVGTACAILFGWWFVQVLKGSMPETVPRVTAIALNGRVIAAASGLALITGILFGIVPALQLSRPNLATALKEGPRGTASAGRQRLRSALVIAELALAVVLSVGAALFTGSFISIMRVDMGFDSANVLTAQVSPRYDPRNAELKELGHAPSFTRIVERMGQIPGVVDAAVISGGMPLGRSMSITKVTIPGRTDLGPGETISIRQVTPGYHKVLGIPLRSGRSLAASDDKSAQKVAILNESAAKKYFPDASAVGRSVVLNGEDHLVVGVVGDVHQTSLEMAPRTEAYVPVAQSLVVDGELAVRTRANPYDVVPAVRAAVFSVLPDAPLRNVTSMEDLIGKQLAQRRLNMLLLGILGSLGVVISAVGVYGVIAHVVAQRSREIGIRMALGAPRSNVIATVLLKALVLVACGVILGLVCALYLSNTVRSFLFEVEPTDPWAFGAAVLFLALAGLIASVIPAWRAASIDPIAALRTE